MARGRHVFEIAACRRTSAPGSTSRRRRSPSVAPTGASSSTLLDLLRGWPKLRRRKPRTRQQGGQGEGHLRIWAGQSGNHAVQCRAGGDEAVGIQQYIFNLGLCKVHEEERA